MTRLARRELLASAALAATPDLSGPTGRPTTRSTYPDDAFSRPPEHRIGTFGTLAGCSLAGSGRSRTERYESVDLRLAEENHPSATVWRFRLKSEAQAVLVISERLRQVPEAISFEVTNRSERPVAVSLQVHETPWEPGHEKEAVAWSFGAGRAVSPGQSRRLRFAFADATPSAPADRGPACPMGPLVIAIQGVALQVDYEVVLRDLVVHYPTAAGISASRLACRRSATAGRPVAIHVVADGTPRALSLELRREPWVLWRTHLTPQEARAACTGGVMVRRVLPWHVPSGDYTLGLVSNGLRVANGQAEIAVANRVRPELPKSETRRHKGRTVLYVNGRPTPWQGYASYDYQPGPVAEFGSSGAGVFCVPVCAGQHVYHITPPSWVAPDRFDFGDLDERVAFSLESNPRALLFLRVSLALPTFWAQSHESERVQVDLEPGRLPWVEGPACPAASLASTAWRTEQARALRELVAHCRRRPWASRLVGFWLGGGTTEEWFAWGSNDGNYSDYSEPAGTHFASWHSREVAAGRQPAFPTAVQVPLPAARRAPGFDIYPPNQALSAAYNHYQSELAVNTIAAMGRVIKEETGRRSLACTFYGYVLQLAGEPRQALSGHFALRRLLGERDIDVVGGIPFFEGRDLANGCAAYVVAYESIQAAGKLYCNENDLFSWLHHSMWHTDYSPADPRGAAISMHRRICAQDAVVGGMAQKFSLLASWHHDHELQRDFSLQSKLNSAAMDLDRTPAEEVAFVVDDTSFAWTPPETMWLYYAHKNLLIQLMRTGAPVGVWLLSDLGRLPRRIRFVVVASAAAARQEDLLGLRRLLDEGGRTVVVLGAPGLVDIQSGQWQGEAVGELLGLPLTVEDRRLPGGGAIAATGKPLPGPALLRPRVRANQPGLLTYSDGVPASAGRALAHDGRLIWCGIAPADSHLLSDWLDRAGIHRYGPTGFSVHASRGLVSITAPSGGAADLAWPTQVQVTDLFDGWTAAGRRFACPFETGQTRLFRVSPVR